MMSPEEKREEFPGYFSAVMISILEHWHVWALECARLDQSLDWLNFFDGCAVADATADCITVVINRAKYYPVYTNRYAHRVMEQALFNIITIPFRMRLEVGE